MSNKIILIVPPGVHLLDINGPAHIFYEAKEYGADLDLHFVSLLKDDKVTSSAGLKFYDLVSFEQFSLNENDFILVPGIYFPLLSDKAFLDACLPFFSWLRKQHQQRVNIGSVCTGAFLLAESAILQNRACTTHWKRIKKFKERYPDVVVKENRLFIVDKNIYSSAGITSGIDLSLYIIEEVFGTKMAVDVAKEAVVYFRRGIEDPQLSIYLQYRNHLEDRIHHAQEYIQLNLGARFNLSDIGTEVGMSVRNLTRLFKKATGITIKAYSEKLKVERAQKLLLEKCKVNFIAQECGFKSTSQLLEVLAKHKIPV